MPPTKFWLNLTYHSGADEVWRLSRLPTWRPTHISDQNYFSNSESLCHSDASHQVWAQFTLQFGRRCLLKNFKRAQWWLSWMSEWKKLRLESPTKFQLNLTYHSRADVVSKFSSLPPWQPSWILEWNQSSNSKSPCHPNASHQGWTQSDLPFRSRHGLKIFKMATIGAILDIRMEKF